MISIGIVGCEGKLASSIIECIDGFENINIIRAISSGRSIRIGESLSEFTAYNKNEVYVENELLNCSDCDVLIDATSRDALLNVNLKKYAVLRKPVIIATTGFNANDIEKIRVLSKYMPVIQEANFSIELCFFIQSLKKYAQYARVIDITIIEKHHKWKKDKPSGTACVIKKELLEVNNKLNIEIVSVRGGIIHGEHNILFTNNFGEEICFTHKASSRTAFANGILQIIPSVVQLQNGLYRLKDIL